MAHQNEWGQPIGFPVTDWQAPPLPQRNRLQGNYCSLELLAEHHAKALSEANSVDKEGRMWTYMSYGPFDSLGSYEQWLRTAAIGRDPLFYAILDKNQKALGVASYLRIAPASGSLEVGHIAYSPLLQKTLVATEAMFLMMQHAFELGYRRYEWKCDALNAGSRRAAERLGFSFEGIFRQATLYKGRNRDTAWYAVLDKDWPRLKAAFEAWLEPSNFDAEGKQKKRLSDLRKGSRANVHS